MSLATSLLLAVLQLDAPPLIDVPHPWTLTAPLLPSSSTVRTLPLQIASSRPVDENDAWPHGCGPGPVLIAVSSTSILIGAAGAIPLATTSIDGLRDELQRLKALRRDRSMVVLQVDDDVDLAAIVAVVDAARGLELWTTMPATTASRFGLGRWVYDLD